MLIKKLEEIGELDNTLVVISGDHGMPGVPGGKCNLYDHGVAVALMVRGPGIKPGRVVGDFVNLMEQPARRAMGGQLNRTERQQAQAVAHGFQLHAADRCN